MTNENLERAVLGQDAGEPATAPRRPSVEPTSLRPGTVVIEGNTYWKAADGSLVPEALVKPADALKDQTVRSIIGFALELRDRVARFYGHTVSDIDAMTALLGEKYQVKVGGRKGNVSFFSYDGLYRVQIQMADRIVFGPELQMAKAKIDECLREWSADAQAELRALVTQAFDVDHEGQVNRSAVLGLRRLRIEDERWQAAMQAIDDSIIVVARKSYLRFSMRDSATAPWTSIRIDLAAAGGA